MRPCKYAAPAKAAEGIAFTLTELLVIIALLGLVFLLRLPALARAKDQSHIAQCAANLRQFASAAMVYANDNGDRLPVLQEADWPTDMGVWETPDLLIRSGATRKCMYCPAFQELERCWSVGIIGYSMTFSNQRILDPTNINVTLTPRAIKSGGPVPRASQRVLLADATLSRRRGEIDDFVVVPGAVMHRTPHLTGVLPAGGNLAMLDGHVEWREFQDMRVRTHREPFYMIDFWW